jgi:hypothetical protein
MALFFSFCGELNDELGEAELDEETDTPDDVDDPDEFSFPNLPDEELERDRIDAGIDGGAVCGKFGCKF